MVMKTMPIFMAKANALSKASLKHNGFTLVELMIVIFIIGLSSALVILTLPSGQSELRADSEKFAARVAVARDNAILQSRPISVWIAASGYGFEELLQESWQPALDSALEPQDWSADIIAQTPQDRRIRVVFDSTGLPSDGFNIKLSKDEYTQIVTLNAVGSVEVGN